MMNIAIVGHGNVGGTLARKFQQIGHQIVIGAREPEDEKVKALTTRQGIDAAPIPGAVKRAEVILVATPPQAARELVEIFDDLFGKTLIDATNTVHAKPEPYATAYHAFEALTQAEVVKCFNSTGFENMANPDYDGMALDMFMAGNSMKAKNVAAKLAKDCGFENCIDFGGSDRVELLESLALAWINLANIQGLGRDIGWKLLKR